MSRDAGREFVRDAMVVYIYHNTVDATGDNAATETKTFAAVRQAITEIDELVSHIINNLNGSQVLVTADHGFLFQESSPEQTQRSGLDEKPDGTVLAKKRYLLGHRLPDHESVWHGSTRNTAQADGDMEFWIPKGVNRFHFTGGARFVHGGAMPQEIVVPVVEVRALRGDAAQSTKGRHVAVHVLGTVALTRYWAFSFSVMEKVLKRLIFHSEMPGPRSPIVRDRLPNWYFGTSVNAARLR